jgi:hypothetical protein
MKEFFFICLCVTGMVSCSKPRSSTSFDNGKKLIAIECDSAGSWEFGYAGNLIAKMSQDTTVAGGSSIQYTDSGSDQLVTVFSTYDSISYPIIYTVSAAKLPLTIDQPYTYGGTPYLEEADFIYFPMTSLLDSVTLTLYGGGNTQLQNTYKFTYTDQNITQIDMNLVSGNVSYGIGSVAVAYSHSANIFRHTDSLLYIYAYPGTVFQAQPMLIAAFFAETFSASTFNGISLSGLITEAYQNDTSSKMTYTLNQDGKLIAETFDDFIFAFVVGKKFVYK